MQHWTLYELKDEEKKLFFVQVVLFLVFRYKAMMLFIIPSAGFKETIIWGVR